jgi:hypothetical protein
MIREVFFRVRVQKSGGYDHYYPVLISATTSDAYPFQVPTADIKIVSNARSGTSGYISPIKCDDHIRLQVAIRYNPNQRLIYTDIFQGTIQEISQSYGTQNSANLHCVGYMDEVLWTEIEENYSWTWNVDVCEFLLYFLTTKGYRRRLTWSASYGTTGIIIPSYDVSVNQTFMSDAISDFEKMSGYRYRAFAVPVYDGNQNFSAVYLSWRPLPTTVTSKYAIIEGTDRYISSEFSSSIEDLATRYVVIGSQEAGYNGAISANTAKYGRRTKNDSYNWITTSAQVVKISEACRDDLDDPKLSGTATIIGTPAACVGDLVYCKSPSQEVNGSTIDTNMTVYRVTHNISEDGKYTTSLDLDMIYKNAYDYIGKVVQTVKTNKKNSCKR